MDDTWSYTDDKLVATYPKRPETWNRDLPMFAHLFCRCAGPEAALSLSLAFTKYPGCIWSWCHLMWILLFANLLNLFWGGNPWSLTIYCIIVYHYWSLFIIIHPFDSTCPLVSFVSEVLVTWLRLWGIKASPWLERPLYVPGAQGGPTGGDVAMTRGSVLLG